MAQSIVLKRSALSGKVPDTGSLSLGEIAVNTYDGRVFFKKSGSSESVEHIVTTNSITTGSITLTQTGSFGEIIVTQDGNFQRDIFVTRDIVANGDIDVLGSLTASLSNGYVWVGNGSNKTTLVPTSSFGGAVSSDVNLLISKTGSYASTGSNIFIGNQTISGSLVLTSSLTLNDTSNQILVRNTGSGIIEYASINSLLNTKNLVTVGLSGSDGAQFNSIKAAVDSITDASEYNTYTVRVGPGVFYETAITMKSWITVKGDSTTTTIVSASNASASVFIGADQSMLIDMQIQGTTAPSQSAVVYSSPTTPQTNAIFYVENVRFGTNYTHAKVIGTSGGNCIMQCSNVKYGGYPFTLGFHATNDGSGIGRMQLRNVTSTNGGVTTTTDLVFAKADKPSCAFIVNGCLLTKAVGAAAGTGFWVENGGSLRLTSVNFQRWDKAIYAPNVGSAPSIFGSALNFENNTYDVFVEHPTITGHIEGTDTFLKSIIPADAPLYEVNTDPRRLVVAKKGGDFSSISASVAWITDSSETNRYVIEVGPGQFTENTIDLTGKPYVSIVGSNIQTTQIFPATANQHIIKMGVNNEISFLSLANAGSGYAAIYVDDVGDFAQAHKISIYDCDTGIKVLSRDNDTQFYGEYIDINGTFTYGTYVSGSNNSLCTVNVENYYLFPSGCAAIGNYVTHPSASLSLHSSTFQGDSTPNAVGLQIEDGSLIEVSGLDLQDWDYGVRVPNVGTGPKFRFVGTMIHGSSTYDIEVLNTQTQGRFQGISDHTMINNLSENVYWNFLDDQDGENDVTRKLSVTFADGTHTDATTLIFKGSSMGVLEGGEITISGSLTIKTQAGYGYLHDPINPEVFKRFDWIDTNLTLSPNTNNYIYINSTGTLTSSVTIPNFAQNIILGRVVTNNTGVEFIDQSPWNAEHTANRLSKFNREALGPVFAEGSIVTENVTPFKLDVTQGNYYFSENNFLPVGTSSINLTQYYISGSGWNVTTSSIVPNNVYASGSQLIAMSASYYTKHSVYLVGDGVDEKYFLVINNNQYSSLVEAEGASLPNIPTYFNDGVVAIASVYVQSGSSNITQIQDIRPVIGFRAAGVNASAVHGNLLGLNQDDHTQYLLVNGNRSMAGNLNLGNNDITNVDSITATTINGSINATNGVVSGSSQITISATTGYSTFSSSLDSRLDNLESFTSSLDVTFVNQTELANATGSLINLIATKLNTSSFNSYTSSNDSRVSSLESFTASLDANYVNQNELETATGSLINSIGTKLNTGSFETYTGSIDNKFITLANVTASLINATSSYETTGRGIISGSNQITPLLPTGIVSGSSQVVGILSSLNSYTASNDTTNTSQNSRLSSLESFTSSLDVTYVNETELANATGSLINSIATKLNTSSFNSYTSSNDTRVSNLESFSSSLDVTFVNQTELATATGSLINSIATKLNTSSFEIYTSSIDTKFTTLASVTSSLNLSTASQQNSIDLIGQFTASTNSRLNNIESFTASLDVTYVNQTELANATSSLINSIAIKLNTSSFEVYTGSIDNKFTTLANVTSSLNASTASHQNSIDLIGQFTSSENTKNSTLATYTGSVDTKFTTLANVTASLNQFTSSANTRFSNLESFTASLDATYVNQTELATATGSLINSIATKLNTSSFETYTGSIDNKFANLSNTTASLNASTASQQNSIDLLNAFSSSENSKNLTLATYTGSIDTKFTTLATYTSSVDTKFTTLQNVTSSILSFTSSANSRFSNLESFTASIDNNFVNNTELANATGSLINSIATKIDTSSFQTYTGSIDTKFTTLANLTSSLNASTASQQNSIDLIGQFTSSENTKNTTLATYTGSVDTKFTTLENLTASLNASTASQQNSIDLLGAFSASENTKNTTLGTYTGSVDTKFTNLQTTTASIQNSITLINTFTSSVDTKFTTLQNVTSSLISKTGSYATTGSNTFYGTQTMSGSVYVTGDLVVIGSSSISNISASSLSIGDNQIVLNTFTPAIRFGGISVIDSGSNGTTGSLWWDSVNNHWLYEHPGDSPATYNSAILIAGPTNTGSLGEEVGLTSNRLTVAVGTDHISSSQIYVDNSSVSIPSNLYVTGSFIAKGSGSTIATISGSQGELFKVIDTKTNILAELSSGSYMALQVRNDLLYTSGAFEAGGVVTGNYFAAANNGNGTNFKVGDDIWIGDVNIANTMQLTGQQAASSGHIKFGSGSSNPILGANNSPTLELNGSLSVSGSVTMLNRHAFSVYGSGTTSNLTTTQNTDGTLNNNNFAVDFQQGSGFNASTGIFTAPIAGLYQVDLIGRNSGYSSGISQLAVVKNNSVAGGNVLMIEWGASSTMNHAGGSKIFGLGIGDTLRLKVLAGQINFDGNDNWSVAYIG